MNIIESKDNLLIKEVKKLHKRKNRIEKGQFIVEGFRFVEEALKSFFKVEYLFIGEDVLDKYNSLNIKNFITKETKIYVVKKNIIKELCETDNPQGIIAVVWNNEKELVDNIGFYVLVDKIQDPGNLGTIIRSAHASGALGVITTKGTVDVYNDKTLRATMGSIFNIPVKEDVEFQIINKLKKNGFKFIVSSLDTEKNFYNIDLKGKVVICVGNEGNGISEEVYSFSDEKVKIPMPGGAESLNAAVAASIMMYEVVRQSISCK
ncbi:23S rRNA (uridine(2479)-2'-O)-methyltransferase [Clostridium homopropionicum DSM 5847]|uniref:23S rRNA (Uridine(2479)-2'-O)-methyltransferase n=1 Tax=Clostridium homopropionicum DSM 5847 TaxID=1121318 RepID=A0A0L6ZBS8_9CLOT|nr:RNA methyltransferase [Clostridium homopropionicum]KOA20233.1 23S rRNA (uridine(2479)-2'-O)-methyltransferase [Clostridium homopropionicum DSM 5847]SFG58178.1 RNA methyltransferase, TrmH family [Clostridium homopropionicum]